MELNIKLIQESFAALKPHADEVMEHFYSELFKKYPAAKDLFRHVDMKRQRLALANSLGHIVEYLDEPEHLADYLKKMGARHQKYGANPEHFSWVGDALLSTLAFYLEEHWNDELKNQWVMVYTFGVEKMQEGLNNIQQVNNGREHARDEPSLQDMVKNLAKDLFRNALESETEESFVQLAREKARELLRNALELEIKEFYGAASGQKKDEKTEAA